MTSTGPRDLDIDRRVTHGFVFLLIRVEAIEVKIRIDSLIHVGNLSEPES